MPVRRQKSTNFLIKTLPTVRLPGIVFKDWSVPEAVAGCSEVFQGPGVSTSGPRPKLRMASAAAQTRIVSGGELWPSRRELSQHLKYIARTCLAHAFSARRHG